MVSYSPQLYPDTGTQENPGATAFCNNHLYYIGNGHNSGIWVLTRKINSTSLDPTETPSNEQNYWTQKMLDSEPSFQNPTKYWAGTDRQPACAIADGYLYFIWIQKDEKSHQPSNSVWATRSLTGTDGSSLTWSQPVRLWCLEEPLSITDSNLSVTAWGNYLIGCCKGGSPALSGCTVLLLYDTDDWPSQSGPASWKPSALWWTEFTGWSMPSYADLGGQISMDWFTPGGAKKGTGSATPAIDFIISFFNENTNEACVLHAMDAAPFDQWTDAQPFNNGRGETWTGVTKGVNVIRTPAGRMRAYHADQNSQIVHRTLDTDEAGSEFGPPFLLFGQKQSVEQAPVPAFVMAPSTTDGDKTVNQVYEFVMFKDDGINLRFSHAGKAVRKGDAYQVNWNNCTKPAERKLVVTGIVDSLLPMPAANLRGQSSNDTVGSVDYGTTKVKGDTRSTSWSWSAGFISKGYATAGASPAWQISFNAGLAGSTGRSQTTQTGTALISNTNAELTPQGNYFHGGIIFHRDEYTFYDLSLDGTSWSKAQGAPTTTAIWTTYTGLANNALQPYANTPGDLWSYTKAGWNARMQQLGYPNDNYFDEVITAKDKDGSYVNAVVFGAGGTDNPYLEYAWSTSGKVRQTFREVITTFEESGWHMEASVYAGYSFDLGAEAFGVGEEVFGELLVGGSYSRTTEEKTEGGNAWGITVHYAPPIPPSIRYPGQVTALAWRLYLLKANRQWTDELIQYGEPMFKDQIDPNSAPWRIVFEVEPDSVAFQGENRNLVYRDQDGQLIEAWYYPDSAYSYGSLQQMQQGGYWSWTNLTQAATAYDGSGGTLPSAVGEPCWFAWGLSEPGYVPYTQAVVFRAASGDVYLLWSDRYDQSSGQQKPTIVWTWRNLAEIDGFVRAAGDPVGFHWEKNPGGASLNIIYRGTDGDLHELWAHQADEQWKGGVWRTDNPTKSCPAEEKPASDPCALAWNEAPGPGGPSEHVYYRAKNNKIYGLYYDHQVTAWTQTAVSALTHDGATPTGKPCAFVWNGGSSPSLHVGYRGSTGEIHDLYRQGEAWQTADDPSFDAHATAAAQRAAEGAICGFAWERREAPQTIHWFYLTSGGDVCELWRGAGGANDWAWNNLSEKAQTKRDSGRLPPVAALVQGQVWYFDPAMGSSMNLYLRAEGGSVYELRYEPTGGPSPQTGVWQWTKLTGWVTNAAGNLLPNAASG